MKLYTQHQDRWPASQPNSPAEREATARRGLYLRAQNERVIWQLRKLLPFAWQSGIRKTAAPPPDNCYPVSVPAYHIMLTEPTEFVRPSRQVVRRRAGDMLCGSALDPCTGRLRWESLPADRWNDGNEGEYEPAPTCKFCLKAAQQFSTSNH